MGSRMDGKGLESAGLFVENAPFCAQMWLVILADECGKAARV